MSHIGAVGVPSCKDVVDRSRRGPEEYHLLMAAHGLIAGETGDPLDLWTVVNSVPGLIHTSQPDGYLDFFNQTWLRYVGKPLEYLQGWNWTAVIHPDDVEGIVEQWRASLASGDPFLYEARVRRADGEYRWMLHKKIALRNQRGEIVKWYGSSIEIEDRKRAEEQLRQSAQELRRRQEYLSEAQRLSHTGSFGWRPDSGEIFWSDETYRIFEYDRFEKPTLSMVFQRVHPEDRTRAQQVIEGASRSGTDFEHEYRLLMPDGRVKHVHAIAHALQDASGNLEFVGAVTDITERKAADEALRSSEAYLAEAQRLSQTGSWAWSPETDVRHWSEECYRILGFDPRDGLPRTEEFIQRILPDDQPAFRESVNRVRHTKSDEEVDYRIVHPSGAVRDIHSIGHPVFGPRGDLIEFTGTVIDVTERKAAEEKIREQEMELRQILDLTPQLVAVFGPNNERLYANRNALDYAGLSLDEWRQAPGGLSRPSWFIHPDDRERAARAYSDGIRSGGSAFELELRVQRADRAYRWFLLRCNPLRDEHGQIMRWYVAATDIDDRKSAEEKLQQENAALREEIDQSSMFEEIVGASPALQTVLSRISKVAPSDSTVLITGETGTGKELVARAIHRRSQRSGRPFVSVNCAAIPRDLIASELFGHEKGAFTGAMQRRLGRFEMADGGTIFLDEVGELSSETQVALLRVLQEREFERVGGVHAIRVDVRVISATNRDLKAAASEGTFRQDLFYRLNVFPIEVPPLRDRKEDILMLVEYFVQRYASRAGKAIRSIDKKTLEVLQSYPWPGNIRELQNVIERSVILSSGGVLSIDEMWLSQETSRPPVRVAEPPRFNSDAEPRSEREVIQAALAETRGRVAGPSGAAAKLKVAPSTLDHRIKALKIDKKQFKFG